MGHTRASSWTTINSSPLAKQVPDTMTTEATEKGSPTTDKLPAITPTLSKVAPAELGKPSSTGTEHDSAHAELSSVKDEHFETKPATAQEDVSMESSSSGGSFSSGRSSSIDSILGPEKLFHSTLQSKDIDSYKTDSVTKEHVMRQSDPHFGSKSKRPCTCCDRADTPHLCFVYQSWYYKMAGSKAEGIRCAGCRLRDEDVCYFLTDPAFVPPIVRTRVQGPLVSDGAKELTDLGLE